MDFTSITRLPVGYIEQAWVFAEGFRALCD